MKKKMKFGKILLLIATIFSQIANPVAVLADEVISRPLTISFSQVDEDNDGYMDYLLSEYRSENENDYDNDKEYTIKFETTFTYAYDDAEVLTKEDEATVSGDMINNGSSYSIDVSDSESPLSKYYDGVYSVITKVYEEGTLVYESEEYTGNYTTLKGLRGELVQSGSQEVLNRDDENNYNIPFDEGEYTQQLYVMTGDLSPKGLYRVKVNDAEYSEIMNTDELRNTPFAKRDINFKGYLAGTYTYEDTITLEEVSCDDNDCLTEYTYVTTINYGTSQDNDNLFTDMFDMLFSDGYLVLPAINLRTNDLSERVDKVVTLLDLSKSFSSSSVNMKVLREGTNGDEVLYDSTLEYDEEVLEKTMLENNDRVIFANNDTNNVTECEYTVVVLGNLTDSEDSVNTLDSDDLKALLENYLNDEKTPSMDLYEEENDELGKITFEDIAVVNDILRNDAAPSDVENNSDDFKLEISGLPEKVYVGDTFEVKVTLRGGEVEGIRDYIDGFEGTLELSGLKLVNESITYNAKSLGTSKDNRLVLIGDKLYDGEVLVTLKLMAVEEGDGSLILSGNAWKYLNSTDTSVSSSVEVMRRESENNYLASLTPSVGKLDIDFDRDVTVYTLTVPYDTEKVILSGALEDVRASVTGLIEYELTDDVIPALVTVTSEAGEKRVYTIYIVKDKPPVAKPVTYYYSSNSYLDDLSISGYDIDFDKDTYEYKINVANDVSSLDIKAVAEDTRSRVEITGNDDFKVGENVVLVKVTAEDGSTKEYRIIVSKEDKEDVVSGSDKENSSNMMEKIVIIVLIILVVLGLLYLIFKKDDNDNLLDDKKTLKKKNKQ